MLAACLAGCGSEASPPSPDTGVIDAATPDGGDSTDVGNRPAVRMGTGEARFEALPDDGAIFPLVLGPQGGGRLGGHHVLLSVLLQNVTPAELSLIEVRVLDEGGAVQGRVLRDPAAAPFVAGRELPNLAARLDDCCVVAGRPVRVQVIATMTGGGELSDEVGGTATACPQPSQGASICP